MAEKPTQIAPTSPQDSIEPAPDERRVEARAELRAARRAGTRWRRISRWLGLGIFVFGAILLVYVFKQALDGFQGFDNASRINQEFNSMAGNTLASTIQAIAAVLIKEVGRVLYLLILGFVASAIAARGIQFFAASEAVIDEAVLPEE
jgi:hypothetical protein